MVRKYQTRYCVFRTMCGVVCKHVFHVVCGNERVIDSNNIDHRIILGSTHNKTTNADMTLEKEVDEIAKNSPSKPIDTNVDRLQGANRILAVDNVGKLGLEGSTTN